MVGYSSLKQDRSLPCAVRCRVGILAKKVTCSVTCDWSACDDDTTFLPMTHDLLYLVEKLI